MAQIGLKYAKYSPIDAEGDYTGSKILGKIIANKPNVNVAEAKLYANDVVAESVSEVVGGTIEVQLTEITAPTYAEVLGHAYNETTKEVVRNSNDVAPYCGFGRVIVKMVDNAKKYKAEFLTKVKFKESLTEEKTKGESIEFGTPTLNADFFVEEDGTWSRANEFDTLTEAQTYLDGLMAVPTP